MKTLSDLGSVDKDEANISYYETHHLYVWMNKKNI